MILTHHDGGFNPRLFNMSNGRDVRHGGRIVQRLTLSILADDMINNAWRRGDNFQIEFSQQSLRNNLQMQQSQKSAAKAVSQSGGMFRLPRKTGIIERQASQSLFEMVIIIGIMGKHAAKNHLPQRLESRQRL